ncbi:MAG TPA: zinc ribbon domain-containing protein [Smithellaceae bacterium]|nr:zinc ribbon domain-containing protein [Smithellaceae bacterium]
MPIYEFQCRKCQREFERLLKVDEDYTGLACPHCGEPKPKKLVSGFRTNAWSNFLDTMEKKVNPQKFK